MGKEPEETFFNSSLSFTSYRNKSTLRLSNGYTAVPTAGFTDVHKHWRKAMPPV